jgi:hypothetical protein
LIDVVVADENLNQGSLSYWSFPPGPLKSRLGAAASEQKEYWVPQAFGLRD